MIIITLTYLLNQLNDFLEDLNERPADYFEEKAIRAQLLPLDPFIPEFSIQSRSQIGTLYKLILISDSAI